VIGALVGDSHAQTVAYTLHHELKKVGVGLLNLTSGGCYPVVDIYSNLSGPECAEFNRKNLEYIKSNTDLRNIIVVGRWTVILTGAPFDNQEGGKELFPTPLQLYTETSGANKGLEPETELYKERLTERIYATFSQYSALKRQLIVVAPIPEAGFHVPSALAKEIMFNNETGLSSDSLSTSYRVFLERNRDANDILKGALASSEAVLIKPEDYLCNTEVKGRCLTHIQGTPLYWDDDHLSNYGAALLTHEILKNLSIRD
jgi:hypothetical protein